MRCPPLGNARDCAMQPCQVKLVANTRTAWEWSAAPPPPPPPPPSPPPHANVEGKDSVFLCCACMWVRRTRGPPRPRSKRNIALVIELSAAEMALAYRLTRSNFPWDTSPCNHLPNVTPPTPPPTPLPPPPPVPLNSGLAGRACSVDALRPMGRRRGTMVAAPARPLYPLRGRHRRPHGLLCRRGHLRPDRRPRETGGKRKGHSGATSTSETWWEWQRGS